MIRGAPALLPAYGFADPRGSARLGVWRHWMTGTSAMATPQIVYDRK